MTKQNTSVIGACLLLCLTACAWQVVIWLQLAPSYVLPAPADVANALRVNSLTLIQDLAVTLGNALCGLAIGAIVAAVLAVTLLHARSLRRSLVPLLAGFEAVPKIALAPLLVVWLGIGSASKIALAATLTFYPIFINFMSGLEDIDTHLLDLSRVLRAGRARTLVLIRLPNSLIRAFDALRIALPLSLIGAILGEFISSERGIGYRIITAYANLRMDLAFAALGSLGLLSMALYGVLGLIERAMVKWKEPL